MRFRSLLLIFVALFACGTSVASAKVGLQLDVGWEGHYRAGRWNPVYVSAVSTDTRDVQLDLYAPTDGRYAVRIAQQFSVSPSPRTAALFVPFANGLDEASVTVTDPASGRSIPAYDQNNPSEPPQLLGQPVNFGEALIGISGNDQTRGLLEGQFRQTNIACGYLKPLYLPSVAAGYDALDLLVLNAPDFSRLDLEQQHAIVEWVKSGGILVTWPGTSPLPDSSPLLDALPCKFGETRTYELTKAQLNSLGLSARFAHVGGRNITAVANGARDIHPIVGSDLLGYRRWVGFGQILALPADVSTFLFDSPAKAQAFWRTVLAGVFELPKEDNEDRYNNADETRRIQATAHAMDWMSDVPGAGRFGFSYLAIALCTMMFVVGPVDWFVLKWMGRQPWTWVTTSGWILLVTLGAISIGYLLKSGDLHFRTVSVVDEADGQRVAQTTLAAVYSPRTREYALKFDPQGWWRPAGESGYHSSRGLQLEVDCHQDYRGNRPTPMLINVWNLRFLEGAMTTTGNGMISATLTQHGGKLEGSIVNHSAVALHGVSVRTHDGSVKLTTPIEPGGTLPVSAKIEPDVVEQPNPNQGYAERNRLPTSRPALPSDGDISIVRSVRIGQMLQDRPDVACVFAEYEAPPDEVKLDEPEAKQLHAGMVRALVPLQ